MPHECDGKVTKGADDYFAAGGTLDALMGAATLTEPDTEAADGTFSDARRLSTFERSPLGFMWSISDC